MIFGEDWPCWLQRDFGRIPFEAIMQCYPDQDRLRSIIKEMFSVKKANDVHSCIASNLQNGLIAGLITTNYDLAFETCLENGVGALVVDDHQGSDDYKGRKIRDQVIPKVCFKVHGSAAEGKEHTLVYRLTDEGWLEEWKGNLLRDLLEGRVLVLIGYSGSDFDICPEIAEKARPAKVVWLHHKRTRVQPNARRVLRRTAGLLVEGDLIQFLNTLLEVNLSVRNTKEPWNPKKYFRAELAQAWRLQILNWMACGALGKERLNEFVGSRSDFRKLRAAMFGHVGRYRDAYREREAILDEAELSNREMLQCKLDVAGGRFMYGSHFKGWLLRRDVERVNSDSKDFDVKVDIAVQETKLMMYMRFAQIARHMLCGWLLKLIKPRAQKAYDIARRHLEETREWNNLEALQHNAERIGVATQDGLILPSREGYRSLGLISMDVISKRDKIRTGPFWLTMRDVVIARWCIRKAEEYGWEHEAWKFNWILLWRGRGRKMRHLKGWWTHFWKTQYALSSRFLQLLMNLVPSRNGLPSRIATCRKQRKTTGLLD